MGASRLATKLAAVLLILSVAGFTVGAAYASSVALNPSNVNATGGTGSVVVDCPVGNSCTLSSLSWTITSSASAAPTVTGAHLVWITASTSAANTYGVYVTVYNGATLLASASATGIPGSASPTTTSVTFQGMNFAQIDHIEVDIVQTA